jgi:hypothetical protein
MADAVATAAGTSAFASTTRLTNPMRAASAASTVLPVSISSAARPVPTTRGRGHEQPMSPADKPSRMNAALNRAAGAAIRMSAVGASGYAIRTVSNSVTAAPFEELWRQTFVH